MKDRKRKKDRQIDVAKISLGAQTEKPNKCTDGERERGAGERAVFAGKKKMKIE